MLRARDGVAVALQSHHPRTAEGVRSKRATSGALNRIADEPLTV
jgi:hypothetical protein